MKESTIILLLGAALVGGWVWYSDQLNRANEQIEVFGAREQSSHRYEDDLRAEIDSLEGEVATLRSKLRDVDERLDRSYLRGYEQAGRDACAHIRIGAVVMVSTVDGEVLAPSECLLYVASSLGV